MKKTMEKKTRKSQSTIYQNNDISKTEKLEVIKAIQYIYGYDDKKAEEKALLLISGKSRG